MMETGQDEVRRGGSHPVHAGGCCCAPSPKATPGRCTPAVGIRFWGQCGLEAALFPGESRRVLEEVFLRRPTTWAVTDGGTGRLVGAVGLLPDPKRECPGVAMLGYWLDEACWGRG